jgi:hypothetical protein
MKDAAGPGRGLAASLERMALERSPKKASCVARCLTAARYYCDNYCDDDDDCDCDWDCDRDRDRDDYDCDCDDYDCDCDCDYDQHYYQYYY